MGLNIKIALLVCFGFIGGMSWLVGQIGYPTIAEPPLVGVNAGQISGVAPAADPADRRGAIPAEAVGHFSRASTVAEHASERRRTTPSFRAQESVALGPQQQHVVLPPLLVVQDDPEDGAGRTGRQDDVLIARHERADALRGSADAAPRAVSDERNLLAARTHEGPAEAGRAASDAQRFSVYTIQKGDSLSRISKRVFGSSDRRYISAIVSANPRLQGRENRIVAGAELRIPALSEADNADGARTAAAGDGAQSLQVAAVAAKRENAGDKRDSRWYIVRKRDSLVSIARRELNDASRWREIAKLNRIADANKIVAGARIQLPAAPGAVRRDDA